MDDGDSPYALDMDTLISLVYKVASQYRANGWFAMNSSTASAIRKLKASTSGDYLWQPSSIVGQPDRLLGYPVAVWEQMDDLSTGAAKFPVAFGDFRRAYTIADRHDIRITRDEVTEVGFTKFYVRKRTYGAPVNTNAVKFLKTAA